MNTNSQTVLTPKGLKKIEEEYEYLKVEKRKEIAERIKIARGFGDLSENAEYTAAKEEQAKMETRIAELKKILENAVVIDESAIPSDTVSIGSKVKVYDEEFEEEIEYSIVGSMEANPREFKISDKSPVGTALLGAKVGDVVAVESPDGDVKLKVLEILRD